MNASRLVWLAIGWLLSWQTFAVDIGPTLPVLTKIQGAWKTACRAVGDTPRQGYRIDYLNITFTHLNFNAHIYSDDACKNSVTHWQAKYLFRLGQPLALPTGDEVFELDLEEIEDPADAWVFSPASILKLQAGKLYLGRENSFGTAAASRIDKLDLNTPFIRR